jgi:hypothetical protein
VVFQILDCYPITAEEEWSSVSQNPILILFSHLWGLR